MRFRLPISLNEVASGFVLLAMIIVFAMLVNIARTPVPYQYVQDTLVHRNTTLCPGESLEYEVDIKVNSTPVSIWRTEMWFSETPNPNNKWADNIKDFEYFNWDSSVEGTLHIVNKAKFPLKNVNGGNMGPGNYRYIVNLNTTGISRPTSISIPVTVPASCFK